MKRRIREGILFLLLGMCLCSCGEREEEAEVNPTGSEEVILIDLDAEKEQEQKEEEKKEDFAGTLYQLDLSAEWLNLWEEDGYCQIILKSLNGKDVINGYCSLDTYDLLKAIRNYVLILPTYSDFDVNDFKYYKDSLEYLNVFGGKLHGEYEKDSKFKNNLKKICKKYGIQFECPYEDLDRTSENYEPFMEEVRTILTEEDVTFIEEMLTEKSLSSYLEESEYDSMKKLTSFTCFTPEGDPLTISSSDYDGIYAYVTDKKNEARIEYEKKLLKMEIIGDVYDSYQSLGLEYQKEYFVASDVTLTINEPTPVKVTISDLDGTTVTILGGTPFTEASYYDYNSRKYRIVIPANHYFKMEKVTAKDRIEASSSIGRLSYFEEGVLINFYQYDYDILLNDRDKDVMFSVDNNAVFTLKKGEYAVIIPEMSENQYDEWGNQVYNVEYKIFEK